MMHHTHKPNNRRLSRALGAVGLVTAVPAALLLAAPLASAADDLLWVEYDGATGDYVHVKDQTGVDTNCDYTATPLPGQPLSWLPADHQSFHLSANQTWDRFVPPPTPNIQWSIEVKCAQPFTLPHPGGLESPGDALVKSDVTKVLTV